jgi:hypothetical protein
MKKNLLKNKPQKYKVYKRAYTEQEEYQRDSNQVLTVIDHSLRLDTLGIVEDLLDEWFEALTNCELQLAISKVIDPNRFCVQISISVSVTSKLAEVTITKLSLWERLRRGLRKRHK